METVVIGAGLAGSAVAYALAERGYNVTVLEAAAPQASTAPSAGLPVALMAPHHTTERSATSALSQLSRLGLAATTHAAKTLLTEGQDWQPCGALQRAGKLGPQAHWFADAAWVKPAALVAAWLAHPRITVQYSVAVQRLQHAPGAAQGWQALSAQGSVLAQADAVILANALQAQTVWANTPLRNDANGKTPLLPPFFSLHPVAGQVIMGPWNAAWQALWPSLLPELAQVRACAPQSLAADNPSAGILSISAPCAINGNGHFIPNVPWGSNGERIWLSGSTYEHDVSHPCVTPQGINANLQRLQQLIPAAADLLAAQAHAGQITGWAGQRCTTRDRLPIAGAVSTINAPGIYACTAMGSRGLSFAALCGQHLADVIAGTNYMPLPVHLQRALNLVL
jgi:tRNA 5-methylaminomethyl-2-thiouridine biosynthesis bifunctional protein